MPVLEDRPTTQRNPVHRAKVIGLLQAPDGVMWVASLRGVTRLDSSSTHTWTSADGLPVSSVEALGET